MANAARVGTDLSLEEALEGWSRKALYCFESLREAVRIDGTEWAGIISPLGRQPVPILNLGAKNLCQVHPDGDRVVVKMIRGEDVMEAVRKDRTLSARVKRAFATPGKIKFLAELPVAGVADARAASSVLALKAACMDARVRSFSTGKDRVRKASSKSKTL
jgi:hypothetical protein